MSTQQAQTLIQRLEAIRERDGLSLSGMSRQLGVSHALLVYIRQGKRGFGPRLLRAIIATYPELQADVYAVLGNGHDTD